MLTAAAALCMCFCSAAPMRGAVVLSRGAVEDVVHDLSYQRL